MPARGGPRRAGGPRSTPGTPASTATAGSPLTWIVPGNSLFYGSPLPIQAKSKTFVEPWELDAGASALADIVRKADETGFFYVAVCDHLAVTKPLDAHMGTTWYDTVATLGWIAGLTEHLRLLSHLYVLSYRS